jgi:hypothetical protein
MITWYEHARAYAEAKWPNLARSPAGRRGPGHRHHRPHHQGTRYVEFHITGRMSKTRLC